MADSVQGVPVTKSRLRLLEDVFWTPYDLSKRALELGGARTKLRNVP